VADDSYEAPFAPVGGYLELNSPPSPIVSQRYRKVPLIRRVLLNGRAKMIRDLMANMGFTLSVFAAAAIVIFFAAVFEAPRELVTSVLWLGVITAIAEYVMRSQASGK
jgi:hypothetical protein